MNDDECTVAAFALRYSLGRQTYAFEIVSDFILKHAKNWDKWRVAQMAEEIEKAEKEHTEMPMWEQQNYRIVAQELREIVEEK